MTIRRNKIFVSYSHRDKRWLDELKKWLKPLERAEGVHLWDDTRIKGGAEWREEIRRAIDEADLALLLVSPDFLASEFITNQELPPLLDAARERGLSVCWIAVRESLYEETPVGGTRPSTTPRSLCTASGRLTVSAS